MLGCTGSLVYCCFVKELYSTPEAKLYIGISIVADGEKLNSLTTNKQRINGFNMESEPLSNVVPDNFLV